MLLHLNVNLPIFYYFPKPLNPDIVFSSAAAVSANVAVNFYLKRGYELFDERAFEYNDRKMESWSLKKVL